MKMYNPQALAREIERIVVKGTSRKYYRVARGGRWYGGISTADCCGCQLKCIFCWSGKPRDNLDKIGKFFKPDDVFRRLVSCAKKFGYKQLRISGNEPTIGKEHLLELLKMVDETSYSFILETNGLLIDKEYAKNLSKFKNIHVRVSLKGTNSDEFSRLTGAIPRAFDLQLEALKNLLTAEVSCHPAVMLSFSDKKNFSDLRRRIREIHHSLEKEIEEEYIFLYPHVVKRLKKAGLEPVNSYEPSCIPKELI